MKLVPIKPLSIKTTKASYAFSAVVSRYPYFDKPKKLEIQVVTEDYKKKHLLIVTEKGAFYSFALNAILECFNFDTSKITCLVLEGNTLKFNSPNGEYQTEELIEIENFIE